MNIYLIVYKSRIWKYMLHANFKFKYNKYFLPNDNLVTEMNDY